MKQIKSKYLAIALCAANATMVMAQETATPDSVKEQAKVQLAFREADASDVLVGVSTVDYKEVMEKNHIINAFDDLDAFIAGGTNGWGGSYLVLIDGVPRPDNNVKPEEIASISFLKGANACALYGSHASKGVVLITTKRGEQGDIRIKAHVNTGWNVAKSYPEYVGSAEYATLYNEALANDGIEPLYSELDIYNYAVGENPVRYPDVNFYSSEYLRKAFNRTQATAEIDGGNDMARYYANVDYYREGSHFKVGEASNSFTSRFSVRGNVDVNISDYVKAYVDANVSFYDARGYNGANFWESASTLRPNSIAPFVSLDYIDPNAEDVLSQVNTSSNLVDGQFIAGSNTYKTNAITDMYVAGKSTSTYRKLQFETGLDIDMSFLLKGLKFHTQFGMDYATSYVQSYDNQYKSFEPIWGNYNGKDVIIGFKDTGTVDKYSGIQNIGDGDTDQTYAFDANFSYDRAIGAHTFGAILVARGYQIRNAGEYHAESDASLGLNVRYNFAKRYFLDFTGSIVHTAKLAKEMRNGFSPSVTLGWNLAKESFLEGGMFNNLTLSVSASKLANDADIDGYSNYIGTYTESGEWWNWNGQNLQASASVRGANPELDFIYNKELSVGIKAGLYNDMITLQASAYSNLQEGHIITAGTKMPDYMQSSYPNSSFIPMINNDNNLRKGIDFALGFNKKFGEFELNALFTGSVQTNEAAKRDDSIYEYDYQKRQGKYLDAHWGYECLGFFQSEEEIAASPSQAFGQTLKPGDLKYKDQNGDNQINELDMVELGRWENPFKYGVGITAKYKGVTLFIAGSGSAGAMYMKDSGYYRMSYEDKYSAEIRNRWTPETANTATLPRLSSLETPNNEQTSDFWSYKNKQFNITKVQLTYDFPASMFSGDGLLKDAQVYVSGRDLLKISKEKEHEERNVGSAPQTRFYKLGVKVTF